jgi:hypothetical protein
MNLELVQFHIAGDDLDIVFGTRCRWRASNRHLPTKASAHEPCEPTLPQIQRLVKLKDRAGGSAHHDRPAGLPLRRTGTVGKHDERARYEIDAPIRERLIFFEEQPHLTAFEDDRILTFPRAGWEDVTQGSEPTVGSGTNGSRFLGCHLDAGGSVA